jgi:hypothetical protein
VEKVSPDVRHAGAAVLGAGAFADAILADVEDMLSRDG